MKFNLNQFLISISVALDYVELDVLGATLHHTKRVCYIALKLGKMFSLTAKELFDLAAYAILHDNGLTEEVLFSSTNLEKQNRFERMEGLKEHCRISEENIKNFPFQTSNKNILLYHHENYNGSGFFHKNGNEIPLLAQIVALADFTDNVFHLNLSNYENKIRVIDFIKKNKGVKFSPELSDAFLELAQIPAFWYDLQSPCIDKIIYKLIPNFEVEIDYKNLYNSLSIFSKIIDCKTKFTSYHTRGIVEKAKKLCEYYAFDDEHKYKFMISASLHDLGKLAIPNSILNKNGRLNKSELYIMQSHVYLSRSFLENIDSFDDIVNWATNHHEKLNGTGYPYHLKDENLCLESRMMACIDIYQALREKRPYREGDSHKETMEYLFNIAKNGGIDLDIVNDIDIVFKS